METSHKDSINSPKKKGRKHLSIKSIFDFIRDNLLAEILFLGAVGLVAAFVFLMTQPAIRPHVAAVAASEETASALEALPVQQKNIFNSITIKARSAIVVDVTTGKVLYQKDADRVLPLASITKVITALTALSMVPNYTTIPITSAFLATDGDTGLLEGENWSLKNLLAFTLPTSSNDGAKAIASVVGSIHDGTHNYDTGLQDFIKAMNTKAHSIGLTHAQFWNATGLDLDKIQSGGYDSARDIASLFEYVLKNDPGLMESTARSQVTESSYSTIHTGKNTDTIVDDIPGILASKTGYTNLAGGNLAIAFNVGINHPVVIVVLDSTYNGRFTDVERLAQATLSYYSQKDTTATLAQKNK